MVERSPPVPQVPEGYPSRAGDILRPVQVHVRVQQDGENGVGANEGAEEGHENDQVRRETHCGGHVGSHVMEGL